LPSDFKAVLAALREEAVQLRFSVTLPASEADPQEITNSLLEARAKTDRVEGVYYKVVQIKSQVSRDLATRRALHEEQWAQSLISQKRSPVAQGDNFIGPRERYAEADLATITLKRDVRLAEELMSLSDECHEIVRTCLRGLNDLRQDHLSWLRSIQVQSYLES
jgi:hypothetical protein